MERRTYNVIYPSHKVAGSFGIAKTAVLRRSGYVNEKMRSIFESKMVKFKVVLLEENSL